MIRPRIGDFYYSTWEIYVMLQDIQLFKQHRVSGFVFGALKDNGDVDVDAVERYCELFLLPQTRLIKAVKSCGSCQPVAR